MSASAQKWIRVGFAGPGAILVALVVIAGMALWLPRGAAGIDNLVLPLILIPVVWAALFFHACLDRRLSRVVIVAIALFAVHATLVVLKVMDTPAPAVDAKR